jgi:hypothetical protein
MAAKVTAEKKCTGSQDHQQRQYHHRFAMIFVYITEKRKIMLSRVPKNNIDYRAVR